MARADGAHAASWQRPATAEQEGADAAGTDAAGVDAAGVDAAGAGAEEGLQPRLAAAADPNPNPAGLVEALARMEIRAVSAELALSEARQLEAEQRLRGGAEELYREMEVYREMSHAQRRSAEMEEIASEGRQRLLAAAGAWHSALHSALRSAWCSAWCMAWGMAW